MGSHRKSSRLRRIVREWTQVILWTGLSLGISVGIVAAIVSSQEVKLDIQREGYPPYEEPSKPPKPVDGTFVAGVDWEPGEWSSDGGKACRWEVRKGREVTATGEKDAVVIELTKGQSLTTKGCGAWRRNSTG